MALLSMQNVSLTLGGKELLSNAGFSLDAGERVCLTGRNGAGKSSLLALLGGSIKPDSGNVVLGTDFFGQMSQAIPRSWKGTVFSLVVDALGTEGADLLTIHSTVENTFETHAPVDIAGTESTAWERYSEVSAVINHLQLNPEADFQTLSGGIKRRVALARALLCSNDLILDEPTNHLDLSTILWLEDFLLRRIRSLIFVSHDRDFCQRLATRVVEIDRGKLHNYACEFDAYLERREERLEIEEKHFAEFDKKLAKEETWIRQGVKARRTRNMGRVRALEAMRKEHAARKIREGNARMLAQEAERSGQLVIEAENVSYAYPGTPPIFTGFSTVIQRGDKIGLIGANGTGKTTLLKLLVGELSAIQGTIRHGTQLQVSYFDQLRETLDPQKNLMDTVAEGNDVVTINGKTRHVAGYLQDFLFTPDRLRVPVSSLSGGEKNRLLLARLFTKPSNLLILDEPTNDLDVETLELLEELLAEYTGTIILVSHDRRFLDHLVTSTLALEGDGQVHEYVGAYTDWLRQRSASIKIKEQKQAAIAHTDTPKKRSYNEQRELKQFIKEIETFPAQLGTLEKTQRDIENKLANPDFFNSDPDGFAKIANQLTTIDAEQMALLERWEYVENRIKNLESHDR